jgi:rubrerythrin
MTAPMQQLLADLAAVLDRHGARIETGYDCTTWLMLGSESEQLPVEGTAEDLRGLAAEIGERERRWAVEALADFFRAVGCRFRCGRCKHAWSGTKPRQCPQCHSARWDA